MYIPPWPPAQPVLTGPAPVPRTPVTPLMPSIQCHQLPHLWHHPNSLAKAIPQVGGHKCPLIFTPPCSCIRMPTLQCIGLQTCHTMQPHREVLTRIQKQPNPTSSLVRTPQSCAPSSLAVSWPLTVGLASCDQWPMGVVCCLLPLQHFHALVAAHFGHIPRTIHSE